MATLGAKIIKGCLSEVALYVALGATIIPYIMP